MYYRLDDQFSMRGWDKMSWTLVRHQDNAIKVLEEDVFRVLLLCDGETDIDPADMTERMRDALIRCIKDKLVIECKEKKPLNDEQCYKLYQNRYVRTAFWSITGRCNCKCRHCYMDAPDGLLGELSTEEAISMIDQMAECGILHASITGGEPLVRKDFWQLIDRLMKHHIQIDQVYTNGLLLTENALNEFKTRGIYPQLVISFDGSGWHDWMRGVPGIEEKTLKIIRNAVSHGFLVSVGMCVHKGNIESVGETVRTLAKNGVYNLKIGIINDTELWKKNCDGNRLTKKEYYDGLLKYIPQFFKDGMPMNVTIGNMVVLKRGSTEYQVAKEGGKVPTQNCEDKFLCNSARLACYITPEGRLLPCLPMTANMNIQQQFPLIREIGLRNGLSNSCYMEFVSRKVKDLFDANQKCNTCQYRKKCLGGCRACALESSEDNLMGSDEGMCLYYYGGYPEKIRIVCDEAIAKYCPNAKKANQ